MEECTHCLRWSDLVWRALFREGTSEAWIMWRSSAKATAFLKERKVSTKFLKQAWSWPDWGSARKPVFWSKQKGETGRRWGWGEGAARALSLVCMVRSLDFSLCGKATGISSREVPRFGYVLRRYPMAVLLWIDSRRARVEIGRPSGTPLW